MTELTTVQAGPGEPWTPCAYDGRPLPPGRRRFCCDECQRKGRAAERVREPEEYTAAIARMVRGMGAKAGFDDAAFGALVDLDRTMPALLTSCALALKEAGFSWGDIGRACGMSRQAARQRWGAGNHEVTPG
jgi:hypothetical protein